MGRGMRSEWRVYVLAITASALFGATTVLISLAVGRVTDEVVVPALAGDADARDDLWVAGLVLVAIALTLALTVAGRRIFAGYGYANIQAGHRTAAPPVAAGSRCSPATGMPGASSTLAMRS